MDPGMSIAAPAFLSGVRWKKLRVITMNSFFLKKRE
jgi:hypothetical protein